MRPLSIGIRGRGVFIGHPSNETGACARLVTPERARRYARLLIDAANAIDNADEIERVDELERAIDEKAGR